MSNCNNSSQNCSGNNIYVSGSETRTTIEVTNNKSRYYAELAESYKNKAKEYCDSARYYAEQNSDVSMNYVNNLESTLRNLINTKQDAGEYALTSAIPTKTSDLTNDSNFATTSQIPTNNNQLTNGAGYITGINSSDVTTALTYTPADIDLSNISATGQKVLDGQWVPSYLEISTATSADSRTHDLSSYLPSNDDYEVFICMSASINTSNASGYLAVGSVASPYTNLTTGNGIISRIGVAYSYSKSMYNTCIIPVHNRTLYSQISSALTGASIAAYGYRRIGTNQ